MEVSTSGITRCYSQKCKQFLEEAPAGTHITVKKKCMSWMFLLLLLLFDREKNIKLSLKKL